MRIALLLLFASSLLTLNTSAQVIGGQIDKLFDLYLLEKYDDCFNKALGYTENEKTRSNPEPYLYVAMVLIKYQENPDDKEAYGDPLKDALKYAAKAKKDHAKCLKKDIETFAMEDNLEFFEKLTTITLEEIVYQYNEDKFSKAASWGKKLAKVETESSELQVLVGANMLLSKNMEGQKLIDLHWPKLQEKYKSGDVVPEEYMKPALVYGLLALAKYYDDNGNSSKAVEVLEFGKNLLVDNRKIEAAYEEATP
jgi:hypothetical protein